VSAGQRLHSRLLSHVFHSSLHIYRKTIKRVRPLHEGLHWLSTRIALPPLEALRGFRTMPDDPLWFRFELLTQRHEHETTAHIKRLMRPGMTVLDIGAHVGYYACLCAKLAGSDGRVIAFEPHPRNRAYLMRNTERFGNVQIVPVAAAEQAGSAELYDYLMMSASGSLHYDESLRDTQRSQVSAHDIAPRLSADFQPQTFTVRTAPVDACLAELGVERVDLIKMDIEGAELGALRGLTRTIQQSPDVALVMEYNPMGLQAFEHDPLHVIPEVLRMGFQQVYAIERDASLRELTHDDAAIQQLTQDLTAHMGVINLLFMR
jgi:FkbM family methyltransferase